MYQIIMLYTLNIYIFIDQLHLNNIGGKCKKLSCIKK